LENPIAAVFTNRLNTIFDCKKITAHWLNIPHEATGDKAFFRYPFFLFFSNRVNGCTIAI